MTFDILYNNVKISMCQKGNSYAVFRDIYFTGIIIKYLVVFVKNIIVYATLAKKVFLTLLYKMSKKRRSSHVSNTADKILQRRSEIKKLLFGKGGLQKLFICFNMFEYRFKGARCAVA